MPFMPGVSPTDSSYTCMGLSHRCRSCLLMLLGAAEIKAKGGGTEGPGRGSFKLPTEHEIASVPRCAADDDRPRYRCQLPVGPWLPVASASPVHEGSDAGRWLHAARNKAVSEIEGAATAQNLRCLSRSRDADSAIGPPSNLQGSVNVCCGACGASLENVFPLVSPFPEKREHRLRYIFCMFWNIGGVTWRSWRRDG